MTELRNTNPIGSKFVLVSLSSTGSSGQVHKISSLRLIRYQTNKDMFQITTRGKFILLLTCIEKCFQREKKDHHLPLARTSAMQYIQRHFIITIFTTQINQVDCAHS